MEINVDEIAGEEGEERQVLRVDVFCVRRRYRSVSFHREVGAEKLVCEGWNSSSRYSYVRESIADASSKGKKQ